MLKRKNEDKAKGLPRRQIVVMIIIVVLLIGAFVGVTLQLSYQGSNQPTGQIFYTRDGAIANDFIVLDLQTGERGPYEPTPQPPYDPTVKYDRGASPDGQWLYKWVRTAARGSNFYLILTNQATKLAHAIGPVYSVDYGPRPTWSPDSQSLYFAAPYAPITANEYSGYKEELWRIDVATHQLIRLTTNTYQDYPPSVSPDGRYLAYGAVPDGYTRLMTMNLTTGQSMMVAPTMYMFSYSWSPDGQWLAFETNHATGISDIWIVRPDGTDAQGVALEPDLWERGPQWKP